MRLRRLVSQDVSIERAAALLELDAKEVRRLTKLAVENKRAPSSVASRPASAGLRHARTAPSNGSTEPQPARRDAHRLAGSKFVARSACGRSIGTSGVPRRIGLVDVSCTPACAPEFGCPQIRPQPPMFGFTGIRVVRRKARLVNRPASLEVFSMTQIWDEPVRMTIDWLMLEAEAAHDLSGLWSLVKPAQQSTLRLALDPSADPDLSMTHVAMDLREVLEELEWAHPAVPMMAVAVDVGDPPSDVAVCRDAIASLLRRAWQAAAIAPRVPPGDSATAEILMLARVGKMLITAHQRVVRRLP
jgi:hypothetical protein